MPARYGSGRDGRRVGPGVVSESVAVGLGDEDASTSGGGIAPTGTSVAEVSVSSVRAKGPEPIGRWPNGSVGSAETGTSASRWAGAIGCVSAWRKPPSGVVSVNVTWCGPCAATSTSLQDDAEGPL